LVVQLHSLAQTAANIPEPNAASVADIAAVYFGGCEMFSKNTDRILDLLEKQTNVWQSNIPIPTCENCKHWKVYMFNDALHFCSNGVMINDCDTEYNFSCSLHEYKE
jgi:hypothetical protein